MGRLFGSRNIGNRLAGFAAIGSRRFQIGDPAIRHIQKPQQTTYFLPLDIHHLAQIGDLLFLMRQGNLDVVDAVGGGSG